MIHGEDLVLGTALSSGAFGEVWKGSWQGIEVAVKRLRQSLLEFDSFVRVAVLLRLCLTPLQASTEFDREVTLLR